jgi:hypothetical protein
MIIVLYDDGDDDYRDAVTEEWKRDFLRWRRTKRLRQKRKVMNRRKVHWSVSVQWNPNERAGLVYLLYS